MALVTIKKLIEWQKKDLPQDNIDLELLRHFLSLKDLQEADRDLTKVQELVNFLNDTNRELVPMFRWEGVEYGFIPDISEDLRLGEYIDLNTYSKNVDDSIKWLSVLYRPITFRKGNLYKIEEYTGKAYSFEDLDASVLLGAQSFFFQLANEYLKSIQSSLKDLEMEITN